jgi:hypothetical protein
MLIDDIKKIVQAEILTGDESVEISFDRAFASDLMSDVLTINSDNLLLITGLNNLQTIRTAEMAEIKLVLFARNKRPNNEMINLARLEGITIMVSQKSMFHVSGLLCMKPVF